MKKLAVAMKNGVAIVSDGVEVISQVEASNSTIASLEAVKEFLQTVPENTASDLGDSVMVYLPKSIRGLASGAVATYIRGNKTARGVEMQEETVALYKEVMMMFGARCLTVVFKDAQYAGANDKEVATLVSKVWDKVSAIKPATNSAGAPAQAPVNPNLVAKIKELENKIIDAIMEDDEALEQSLNAKLAKLKALLGAPAPQQPATAKEESSTKEDTSANGDAPVSEETADDQFLAGMNS